MAIAYGGISSVSTSQTPTSVAVSGSNTLGIVEVVGTTTTDLITAVTWGGSSMTKIAAVQNPSDRWVSTWYIVNPSSSSTISFTGGSFWRSFSFYYTGVDQSSPVDVSGTSTKASGSGTSLSTALSVTASDCWYIMTGKAGGGTQSAADVLGRMLVSADAGAVYIGDSNATIGTGSQTGTVNNTTTAQMGQIGFAIKPAASATSSIKSIAGVAIADLKSLAGVAKADIKSVAGVSNVS